MFATHRCIYAADLYVMKHSHTEDFSVINLLKYHLDFIRMMSTHFIYNIAG